MKKLIFVLSAAMILLFAGCQKEKQLPDCMVLTYKANGGSGTNVTSMVYSSASIIENPFERTDYVFVEWNTKADGSGKSYKENQLIFQSGYSETTLYAQWSPCIVYHEDYITNDQWYWRNVTNSNCFGTNSNGFTACAEYVYSNGKKFISEFTMSYGISGSSGTVVVEFCKKTSSGPGTVVKTVNISMSSLYDYAVNHGTYNSAYTDADGYYHSGYYRADILVTNINEFEMEGDFYVVVEFANITSNFFICATNDNAYSTNTAYIKKSSGTWNAFTLYSRVLSLGLKPTLCSVSGSKSEGKEDIYLMPMFNNYPPAMSFGAE